MSPAHFKKPAKGIARPKHESRNIPQEIEDIESGIESADMTEKDEDEDELDRLVLGDDTGFTSQLGQDMDLDLEGEGEEDGDDEELQNADIGLEGVDDADV